MLHRIARLAIAVPRRVLLLAALIAAAAAVYGLSVAQSLSAGGFQDPTSESARAQQLLADRFGRGDMQLILAVTADGDVLGEPARGTALELVRRLQAAPHVADVASAWTAPPGAAAGLVGTDGHTGLIVAGITGGENDAQRHAAALVEDLLGGDAADRAGVRIRAGGEAMIYRQINTQNERDLLRMEAIAVPLSFLVLVWVFGGLLAAALPLAVGLLAILGSMAVLRALAVATDVSIFALNLIVAMGLALAIDYTLLIVSRFRDERAAGAAPADALLRTMVSAGRTVVFSALTVALSMAAMALFPMYFLKSFAYAGVAVVALAAVAAVVVTPAVITLLGDRLDAYDVRRPARRLFGRPDPAPRPVTDTGWYRLARTVMRRAVPVGAAGVAVLLVLGAPFLGIRWGFPDDRVLPASASARQVGDELRDGFAVDTARDVTVVLPDAGGIGPAELDRYAAELSRVPDVAAVSAPGGTFVAGVRSGPPGAPAGIAEDASGRSAFLTVAGAAPLFTDASRTLLDRLRAVPTPNGGPALLGGTAAVNQDSVATIIARMPLVLTVIAAITLVLLFLLTGSVVLPLKALVLNVLSLTAAFGALVWVFQDGHLGGFGTTATGTLVATMPVLLFCIAFGLSMDYEVFLISRIREYWLRNPTGTADARARNDEAVALGLARTGRVITAAALIMSISFAALIAAQVSFMRMFGTGLTLAVLADATLVRMVLVPAFMHLLGRYNWWAPRPLARLHARIGLTESAAPTPAAGPVPGGG